MGNVIAGVAKASKAVKAIQTAEKIAGACRTVGKIGNTAAGVKAVYDTYQTAQQECKTTGGKIAYIAGTLAAGYAMGKAANWAAGKVKNLASKAMPKLKTAAKEAAGKLASRFNKGFGSSTSGHMSRNRGFAVNPFYKGEKVSNQITGTSYDIDKIIKTQLRTKPSEVSGIKQHIAENGPNSIEPIPIRVHKGEVLVVDGHHRLEAFKELGFDRVPIKYVHASQLGKNQPNGDYYRPLQELLDGRIYNQGGEK